MFGKGLKYTYIAVYSDPNAAGDTSMTEAQDGLNIEIGSSIPSSMEERKKKKKEKVYSVIFFFLRVKKTQDNLVNMYLEQERNRG